MPLRGNSTSAAPQRWKRKALGNQTARRALFAYDTGVPAGDLGRSNRRQRWARASSSQSPYPSLPAGAESSLIPTLVLSPRKPLRWVFAGAPVLLKFSAVRPRRTAFVRRRVQDRFDLLLPAAAALPTSNRHSRYHPGSAERSGERGKRRWSNPTTTPKAAPTPPTAGKHFFVPTDPSAPGRSLSIYGGTDPLDPRFAHTSPPGKDLAQPYFPF